MQQVEQHEETVEDVQLKKDKACILAAQITTLGGLLQSSNCYHSDIFRIGFRKVQKTNTNTAFNTATGTLMNTANPTPTVSKPPSANIGISISANFSKMDKR